MAPRSWINASLKYINVIWCFAPWTLLTSKQHLLLFEWLFYLHSASLTLISTQNHKDCIHYSSLLHLSLWFTHSIVCRCQIMMSHVGCSNKSVFSNKSVCHAVPQFFWISPCSLRVRAKHIDAICDRKRTIPAFQEFSHWLMQRLSVIVIYF